MPNYDPPTPHAILHHLHAALIPFRAVENRVAFVRADPNGLSQIVDPWGRVVAETPLYRAEPLVADVPLGDGHGTLFTRLGDWFAYVCALVMVAAIVRAGLHAKPRPRQDRKIE
jgi:apolipoprotein N-acyltransferase